MEYNFSTYTTLLTMESLNIPPSNIIPAFIFGTLTYCVILFLNITVVLTIAFNRKLHRPMHILLSSMSVNDMLGATAFFPHLLLSILTQNRLITYSACFMEAILVHFYGSGLSNVLIAMAYDRYIAICCPLKYNTLMSPSKLLKMIIMVWSVNCCVILLLFPLSYRERICSTRIVDIFCNNPSLLKLICGDIIVNNFVGLFVTFLQQGVIILVVIFTYVQILITILYKRQSDAKSKAIQTCGTHLIVFLFFEFNVCFTLVAHRIEGASTSLRKALGASILIFPPLLNPLIYGLKTKDIRQNLFFFPKKRVFANKTKKKSNKMT